MNPDMTIGVRTWDERCRENERDIGSDRAFQGEHGRRTRWFDSGVHRFGRSVHSVRITAGIFREREGFPAHLRAERRHLAGAADAVGRWDRIRGER